MRQEKVISGIKSISDLLEYNFFIPSYQRGYRWKPEQVNDLLDDLLEFNRKVKGENEFYCLQPIVVLKDDLNNRFVVIDGQQRLTTIHIILSCLKVIVESMGKNKFKLEYETRPNSEVFLNNIDPTLKNQNIDYFHMAQAYETVESWFKSKDGSWRYKIINSILENEGHNVKVIWYELDQKSNPIEVFTRLNMGKIGLTNAELIKAIFLSSGNKMSDSEKIDFEKKQNELAIEWDYFEAQLRDDEFWGFLQNSKTEYQNHIEFLFDLMANNLKPTGEKKDKDPHFTFRFFSSNINSVSEAWEKWTEIKSIYQQLHDWFTDRKLFHLIGFLISVDEDLGWILRSTKDYTKTEFTKWLHSRILAHVSVTEIDKLNYSEDSQSIRRTLLLFNILSILENPKTNLRFQFGRYKSEKWDIEHIHSVKSEMPESKVHQKDWLIEVLQFTIKDNVRKDIQDYLDGNNEEGFEKIYDQVVSVFSDPETSEISNDANDISNLALLDSSTNRGYKNAVFPIKRHKVIQKDQKGTFIPLCTKNVFLKYYTSDPDQSTFWGKKDRDSYKKSIVQTITNYFNGSIAG